MLTTIAVADAIALVICMIAVVTDLRRRRIPNWLTLLGIGCGLVLNTASGLVLDGPAGGVQWFVASIAGAAVGLVVFGLPAAFGLLGMGDVKLVVAVGALVRWPLALPLALYIALAGGVIALGYAMRTQRVHAVLRNVMSIRVRPAGSLHRMPYALAIAIGCAMAVVSRHVEIASANAHIMHRRATSPSGSLPPAPVTSVATLVTVPVPPPRITKREVAGLITLGGSITGLGLALLEARKLEDIRADIDTAAPGTDLDALRDRERSASPRQKMFLVAGGVMLLTGGLLQGTGRSPCRIP